MDTNWIIDQFFTDNNVHLQSAGHDTTKGVGNYGGVNDSDGEQSLSMNRLNNQISNGDTRNSGLRFPYDSWNETSFFSDKHIDSNKERNGDDKLLSDAQVYMMLKFSYFLIQFHSLLL